MTWATQNHGWYPTNSLYYSACLYIRLLFAEEKLHADGAPRIGISRVASMRKYYEKNVSVPFIGANERLRRFAV